MPDVRQESGLPVFLEVSHLLNPREGHFTEVPTVFRRYVRLCSCRRNAPCQELHTQRQMPWHHQAISGFQDCKPLEHSPQASCHGKVRPLCSELAHSLKHGTDTRPLASGGSRYLQGGDSGNGVLKADGDVLGGIVAAGLHPGAAHCDGGDGPGVQALPVQQLRITAVQLQVTC